MLSFATEFPVNHTCNSNDFIQAIEDWLLGSPHTRLGKGEFSHLLSPEGRIQHGRESVDLLQFSNTDSEAAAIRYTRRDDELEWITTIVFSRTNDDSWVGIRVSCESSQPTVRLPAVKKPVVVRTLLQSLGGASDGVLLVGRTSFRLKESHIGLAARLISGTSGCRLPIIYVSAGFQGRYIVDVNRLASDLAGMAHVVVEPSRSFSVRLKTEVDSENVYGGTVGVYWPDGAGRRSFYIGREYDSPEELARALFENVQAALTNRRAFERCTWAFVQEAVSRRTIQALRDSGSQEVDKYVELFDKELAAREDRIDSAEKEIMRLRAELRIYEARSSIGSASLLRSGSEQDLYPNEVTAIVRTALQDALKRVPSDSRRQHVLAALLQANPLSEDPSVSLRDRLKVLLRDVSGMDGKVRRGLQEMGFSISSQGKHFKIVFQGDDRYTFTLSKSGSDRRGGLNAALDIGRLLF